MKSIVVKKGYPLFMEGQPVEEVTLPGEPATVAALPERIPFVKPRLLVKEGDGVRIGSPLYEDKRNTEFKFLSPGGGKIARIDFGPRRVIREIVIELDEDEEQVEFGAMTAGELHVVDRSELVARMMRGGIWPYLKELPFRDIARPDVTPPAVIVSLAAMEPFQPQAQVYLNRGAEDFQFGIEILKKLAGEGRVVVAAGNPQAGLSSELASVITHRVKGVYPADDPGAILYQIKNGQAENRSWIVNGQDVVMIGRFFNTGRYPTERVVTLAGGAALHPGHVITRMGAPLKQIANRNPLEGHTRFVVGGIFRGYRAETHSHLGFYETALNLIPEGDEKEFLALFNPGFHKPSYSRAFLSKLNPAALPYNCNQHGGLRACIACGHCAEVCAVDILPQLTYKAILSEEVEEYLEHGLLDCVECGLCSYVCPAKIDLVSTFKEAKASYYKETGFSS